MKKLSFYLSLVLTVLILLLLNNISKAQTSFNISKRSTGDTLLVIEDGGRVGIGLTVPTAGLHVSHVDGVLFGGTFNSGTLPASGTGIRMMWYPAKAAFRAGRLFDSGSAYWDDANIGYYSFATGYNTMASGYTSMALGNSTTASGDYSTALGRGTTAGGFISTALGRGTTASGDHSTALGRGTTASGDNSTVLGRGIEASGLYTVAIGLQNMNGLNVSQDSTLAIMGGKVGIGTATPTTRLEVADTIYSSVGGFKFPDGTVQETAATGDGGASEINDLTDGKTGGNSVFLGAGAGTNDDGSNNSNTAVGRSALTLTTIGSYNTAFGSSALVFNTEGYSNTAYGYEALYSNTTGDGNVGLGLGANRNNQAGSNNTIIGYNAGRGSAAHSKSGNVFLGYTAGRWETGNNKLYIDNSSTATPLIGGDFSANEVNLNGNVNMNGEVYIRDRLGIGITSPGAGMHLVGNGYPNSFMFLEASSGGDAGFRLYEGITDKWHIFNNATLDGLQIYNDVGLNVFFADQTTGYVGIGTTNPSSKLSVAGTVECDVLEIKGGSDIAEPFDINQTKGIKAGMVLAIDSDNPGKLKISKKAYDRRVAGIISGAGGINPGMIMGQSGSVADGEFPVALTGRVYCWADASNGSINPGDLLTTSDIPGHAMKVIDYTKAQGAVIGKAMSSLDEGQGLILVLVSLQ